MKLGKKPQKNNILTRPFWRGWLMSVIAWRTETSWISACLSAESSCKVPFYLFIKVPFLCFYLFKNLIVGGSGSILPALVEMYKYWEYARYWQTEPSLSFFPWEELPLWASLKNSQNGPLNLHDNFSLQNITTRVPNIPHHLFVHLM